MGNHCVNLARQGKPVTCPKPGCGRKRDSHALYKGGFYLYWNVVQEHKNRVDWENRSVKITTKSTSKKQRKPKPESRGSRLLNAAKRAKRQEEMRQKRAWRQKNPKAAARPKSKGFGYRKRFNRFWHAWSGKTNPRLCLV